MTAKPPCTCYKHDCFEPHDICTCGCAVPAYWAKESPATKQEVWSIDDLKDAGLPTTCAVCGKDLMDDEDWGFLGKDRQPTHLACANASTLNVAERREYWRNSI